MSSHVSDDQRLSPLVPQDGSCLDSLRDLSSLIGTPLVWRILWQAATRVFCLDDILKDPSYCLTTWMAPYRTRGMGNLQRITNQPGGLFHRLARKVRRLWKTRTPWVLRHCLAWRLSRWGWCCVWSLSLSLSLSLIAIMSVDCMKSWKIREEGRGTNWSAAIGGRTGLGAKSCI